ncbi:MAG: hypothetical protein QOJ19_90 [Acidimicrobiia bacterium]|nr:hypothetical protein [Acidimicrobiia bacterium]
MTVTESVEFLRRSLLDLDDELHAGDLSPDDYLRLRDEYTVRLARALREAAPGQALIEGGPADEIAHREAPPETSADATVPPPEHGPDGSAKDVPPSRRSGRYRIVGVALAVALFAVGAGVLVARTSGTRTAGQSLSGDIRQTIRGQLDQCLQLFGQGQLLETVKCYDGVIAEQPSSAEAYTYRGWTLVRASDQRLWPIAQQNLDQAVSLDSNYPDARVFRAVLYRQQGRLEEARADLAAFDALKPPQDMRDLVDQMGLRASLDPSASTTSTTTSTTTTP